jgi:hypothetical protein
VRPLTALIRPFQEQPIPVGCSFGGADRLGENHDTISTDRPRSCLSVRRSDVGYGPKWSGHRRVSTGEKPEPVRLLWLLGLLGVLRSTSLRAILL